MKYFKLFLTVCAMAVAMNASAQSKTTAKSKTTTTTSAPAKKTATTTTTAKPATTTTTSTRATTTTTASSSKPAKTSSSSNLFGGSGDYDPACHFMAETKIGSFYGTGGFGANLLAEKEFHQYLAWDILSFDFAHAFSENALTLGLKTGVRAFSPRFANDKLRAYMSMAMGWDFALVKIDLGPLGKETYKKHGFGLTWGIGIQAFENAFIGYDLEYCTQFKSTSHYAKIAWRF